MTVARLPLNAPALRDEVKLVELLRNAFTLEKGKREGPLRDLLNISEEFKGANLLSLSLAYVRITGDKVRLRYQADFSFRAEGKGDFYRVESSREVEGTIQGHFLEIKWAPR